MASLLPLLHDLLPIFMPSKVQVARSGALVAVEERAERPPWYQQKPTRTDAPSAGSVPTEDRDVDVDDAKEPPLPALASEVPQPIRLLDYEEENAASGCFPNEQGAMAGPPNSTGESAPVLSHLRGGPKVFRQNAMVGFSDKMCATVLTVRPRSASAIHHHGEQDTIIYATTSGILLTSPALDTVKALRADIKGEQLTSEEQEPRRFELGPGDFAFVPAWTEHQVVNEGPEGDVSWVLFRGGGEPVQVDLDGWGGGRLKR